MKLEHIKQIIKRYSIKVFENAMLLTRNRRTSNPCPNCLMILSELVSVSAVLYCS